MNIWALKGPSTSDTNNSEVVHYLTTSIKNGISRFDWSNYADTADLTKLKDIPWNQMTEQEQECWSKSNFLLEVEKGDWVVHINLPYWGACLAGQVIEKYSCEQPGNEINDYRHILKLDVNSIIEFERNDDTVVPIISSRLKLQGRYWTIKYVDEFLQTIQNVKAGNIHKRVNETVGIFYLKQELSPVLKNITEIIQKTHPVWIGKRYI